MTTRGITAQIVDELGELPLEQQREVLAFTRSLVKPKGVTGASLLHFTGSISPGELKQIQNAINGG